MDVSLIGGAYSEESRLKIAWNITSWENRNMIIKIYPYDPVYISTNDIREKINITFMGQ